MLINIILFELAIILGVVAFLFLILVLAILIAPLTKDQRILNIPFYEKGERKYEQNIKNYRANFSSKLCSSVVILLRNTIRMDDSNGCFRSIRANLALFFFQ